MTTIIKILVLGEPGVGKSTFIDKINKGIEVQLGCSSCVHMNTGAHADGHGTYETGENGMVKYDLYEEDTGEEYDWIIGMFDITKVEDLLTLSPTIQTLTRPS